MGYMAAGSPDAIVPPNTVDTVNTVKVPSTKPPNTWKCAEVLEFLVANKDDYHLDDEDIKIIEQNKISGYVFLDLNRKDLLGAPFNLADGTARSIVMIIDALKRLPPKPPHPRQERWDRLNAILDKYANKKKWSPPAQEEED